MKSMARIFAQQAERKRIINDLKKWVEENVQTLDGPGNDLHLGWEYIDPDDLLEKLEEWE